MEINEEKIKIIEEKNANLKENDNNRLIEENIKKLGDEQKFKKIEEKIKRLEEEKINIQKDIEKLIIINNKGEIEKNKNIENKKEEKIIEKEEEEEEKKEEEEKRKKEEEDENRKRDKKEEINNIHSGNSINAPIEVVPEEVKNNDNDNDEISNSDEYIVEES